MSVVASFHNKFVDYIQYIAVPIILISCCDCIILLASDDNIGVQLNFIIYWMADTHPEHQANVKIHQVSDRMYNSILDKLQSLGKDASISQRSLTVEESNLLQILHKDSYAYNTLNTLLVNEAMLNEIFSEDNKAEKVVLNCYESMTHLLENFTLMSKVLEQKEKTLLMRAFKYSYEHLTLLLNYLHSFPIGLKNKNKKQSFIEQHLNILEESKEDKTDRTSQSHYEGYEALENRLAHFQQQNQFLKDNLNQAESEIAQLELKLVNILNEREDNKVKQQVNKVFSGKDSDFKEEVIRLRMEIDRMNEQFIIEINKYNQVFRSYESELQELRTSGNNDIIEELETEIVRLRQEVESDNIIIRELRERQKDRMEYNSMKYQGPRIATNNISSRYHYY